MKLGAGVIRVSGATIFRGPGGTVKGLAWVTHAEDVGKGAIVTLEQIIATCIFIAFFNLLFRILPNILQFLYSCFRGFLVGRSVSVITTSQKSPTKTV